MDYVNNTNNNNLSISNQEETSKLQSNVPDPTHGELVQKLVELGFKKRECTKLILRTDGQYEIVKHFLEAKSKLREFIHCNKVQFKNNVHSKKQFRKNSKEDSKEVRKMNKQQKKLEKKAQKEERKRNKKTIDSSIVQIEEPIDWKDVKVIIIDAMNVMFVSPSMRQEMIKGLSANARCVLESLIHSFCKALGIQCAVLYDQLEHPRENEECISFFGAKPSFLSSDEALIHLANQMKQQNPCVITSDKAIAIKLKEVGVRNCTVKEWMTAVARLGSANSNPEDLVSEFMKKSESF